MAGAFSQAIIFLINSLFDIFIYFLAVRLVLVYFRANYFNLFAKSIFDFTQWAVHPLKKFIPDIKKIETTTFFLIIIFESIKFFIIGLLLKVIANPLGLVCLATLDFVNIILSLYFFAIIIQAILSWMPFANMDFIPILRQFTFPILRPLQRITPRFGGWDISPILALLLLQVIKILLQPVLGYSNILAFGIA